MKATIVIVLFIVGALLGPQTAPSIDASMNGTGTSIAAGVQNTPSTPQALTAVDMTQAVGGESTGCFITVDNDGDTIAMCCLDLWLFEICAGVNWSAVQRALPFL